MDIVALYPLVKSAWTVWFFLLFVGIVAWTFRPSRRRRLDAHADIPLRDDA